MIPLRNTELNLVSVKSGTHSPLMKRFCDSISNFHEDMYLNAFYNRVVSFGLTLAADVTLQKHCPNKHDNWSSIFERKKNGKKR